jgi:membrane associated rhomboid family serine protease
MFFIILPYGNDRRTCRFPAVTYALIAANIAAFLWMLPLDRSVAISSLGLVPAHASLRDIISSMFVHANVFHLGWNMLFLWLFGPNVEDALGRLEYTILYLGSGIAAALLHLFVVAQFAPVASNIPVVGASGAIAGILGVFAIRFYKTNIKVFWSFVVLIFPVKSDTFKVPAVAGLGIWFMEQLYYGLNSLTHPMESGVAYWSHIGGMMFGMLLASAARLGLEGSKEYLMTDAKSFIRRGTTWDAVENLELLVDRDPDNADAHAELAKLYAEQQNPHEAIPHFKKSVEIHLRRGERDKASLRYSEMRDYYRDATMDLAQEFQIARYLMEMCVHKQAAQMFQNISFNHPGTPEAEVALMKAGDICLDSMDDPQRAVWCYERFLREYPHSTYRTMVEKSLGEARKQVNR